MRNIFHKNSISFEDISAIVDGPKVLLVHVKPLPGYRNSRFCYAEKNSFVTCISHIYNRDIKKQKNMIS